MRTNPVQVVRPVRPFPYIISITYFLRYIASLLRKKLISNHLIEISRTTRTTYYSPREKWCGVTFTMSHQPRGPGSLLTQWSAKGQPVKISSAIALELARALLSTVGLSSHRQKGQAIPC
jgi:hypothetical protein